MKLTKVANKECLMSIRSPLSVNHIVVFVKVEAVKFGALAQSQDYERNRKL